jgi:hypothetical protein
MGKPAHGSPIALQCTCTPEFPFLSLDIVGKMRGASDTIDLSHFPLESDKNITQMRKMKH